MAQFSENIHYIVSWGNYELRRNWGNYELAREKHEKNSFRKSYYAKKLGLIVVFKNTFSLSHQFYFIKRKKKIKDKSQNTPKNNSGLGSGILKIQKKLRICGKSNSTI